MTLSLLHCVVSLQVFLPLRLYGVHCWNWRNSQCHEQWPAADVVKVGETSLIRSINMKSYTAVSSAIPMTVSLKASLLNWYLWLCGRHDVSSNASRMSLGKKWNTSFWTKIERIRENVTVSLVQSLRLIVDSIVLWLYFYSIVWACCVNSIRGEGRIGAHGGHIGQPISWEWSIKSANIGKRDTEAACTGVSARTRTRSHRFYSKYC